MSEHIPSQPSWLRRLGQAVVYAVVTTLVFLAVAIVLSGPSQRERRETNENVRLLVEEARKNREALCIAVIHNPTNVANRVPRMVELCAEVGVVKEEA